jgi:hypothetical protein
MPVVCAVVVEPRRRRTCMGEADAGLVGVPTGDELEKSRPSLEWGPVGGRARSGERSR